MAAEYDLYGDPTDISGARDDARMEMKPTADPRDDVAYLLLCE